MKEILVNLKCTRENYIKKNHSKLYDFINEYNVNFPKIDFKQKVFNIIHNISTPPKCRCGKNVNYFNQKYSNSCSVKCSNKDITKINKQIVSQKNTIQSKYGVDSVFKINSVQEKIKTTFKKNWGVEHISESNALIQKAIDNQHKRDYILSSEKRIKTNLSKYGVTNVAKLKSSKKKIQNTSIERYGETHFSKTDTYNENVKNTMLKKYGITHLMKDKKFANVVSNKRKKSIVNKWFKQILNYNKSDKLIYGDYKTKDIEFKCNICNQNYIIKYYLLYQRSTNNHIICTKCNCPKENKISHLQKEVFDFIHNYIETYDNYIYSNDSKEEIDIYIPSKNIGIEVNGLYWHSELYREKNYHLNKVNKCLEKEIKLLNIWEDDWNFKQDIVKSMLLNKLGHTSNKIYARKCLIKTITDNKLVTNFLNNNHIQGNIGSSVKIGLYYNEELVSLMTFGKLRKNLGHNAKEETFELLRYCTLLDTVVIGGASKLFHHFLKTHNIKKIISYSSLDFGYTNFYEKLGFKYIRNTTVGYNYINNGIRENRFKYRKDMLIEDGFSSKFTEHQIMFNRGIYRVYNCGNQFWEFNIF